MIFQHSPKVGQMHLSNTPGKECPLWREFVNYKHMLQLLTYLGRIVGQESTNRKIRKYLAQKTPLQAIPSHKLTSHPTFFFPQKCSAHDPWVCLKTWRMIDEPDSLRPMWSVFWVLIRPPKNLTVRSLPGSRILFQLPSICREVTYVYKWKKKHHSL